MSANSKDASSSSHVKRQPLREVNRSREVGLMKSCQLLGKELSNPSSCISYPPFLFSNDPKTGMLHGINYKRDHDRPAMVVGISVMRSVQLTALLCNDDSIDSTPLFIIDNSTEVVQLWEALKSIFVSNKTSETFLDDLDKFLKSPDPRITRLYRHYQESSDYLQDFKGVFKNYGYDKIRTIVGNTAVIANGWENRNTFETLHRVADMFDAQVYAYPSNVIAFLHDEPEKQAQIVENIHLLNPELLITTDMVRGRPTRVNSFEHDYRSNLAYQYMIRKADPTEGKELSEYMSGHAKFMSGYFSLNFRLYVDPDYTAGLIVKIDTKQDVSKAKTVIEEVGIGSFYETASGQLFFQVPAVNVGKNSEAGKTPQNADVIQSYIRNHHD